MNVTHKLYGGYMSISIPNTLLDASQIRQIPDNQEVFLNPENDESLIVEILEYQDVPNSEALRVHFDNLAEENDAKLHKLLLSEISSVELSESL
ncbi:Ran guanine nucleotide release factor, partial [Zancudomyces culisetae]